MSTLRFATVSLALLFGPVLAAPTASASQLAREGDRAAWQERFREARRALAEAEARDAAALESYRKMKRRNQARGDAKVAIVSEREEARAALEKATADLEALTEEARRAGVPPGWLRDPAARPDAPAAP